MITPVPGTILRFNDKVFKVVEVTTTKSFRPILRDGHPSYLEVNVPALAVLSSHPEWGGWRPVTCLMHLSYWKSMCTRGATELPADWQPPAESAEARKYRERKELLRDCGSYLPNDLYAQLAKELS